MLDQKVNILFAQAVADFGSELRVVEIGAGTGSLTHHLLRISQKLDVIERDRDLIPILSKEFADSITSGRLLIHEADGARFDLSSIIPSNNSAVLVGNLPYHLTSSIIFLMLKYLDYLKGAVFLVQKEVADRLNAEVNTKSYGFLTVVLNLLFEIEKVTNVNRNAFWPIPKVDSSIIKLRRRKDNTKVNDLDDFVAFVREVFQQRRKKLSTILRSKISKDNFENIAIDGNNRPENLTAHEFLNLYHQVSKNKIS